MRNSGMSINIQKRIEDDAEYRNSLVSWLAENGIDSNHVPHSARPSFAGGRMTIQLYKVNEDGVKQRDPMDPNQLERHTVTVDLQVAPTPDVELWATPPCPTCGR